MIGPTEELLLQQIRAYKLPEPVRQYNDPSWPRKWKVDFAWTFFDGAVYLLLDVEGAVHRMKEPFKKGADRRLWLRTFEPGYFVVTADQVRRGLAIDWLRFQLQEIKLPEFNAQLVKHGVIPKEKR